MSDRPRFPWEQPADEPQRPDEVQRRDDDVTDAGAPPDPQPPADDPGKPPEEERPEAAAPRAPMPEIPPTEPMPVPPVPPGPPPAAPPKQQEAAPERISDEDLSVEAVSFTRPGSLTVPHTRGEPVQQVPPEALVTSLPRKRARTLAAFADALIPPGGSALPSAHGAGVPARADAALRRFDDAGRQRISRMLRVLEWAPVLSPSLRPLSRLNAGGAESAVIRALGSRVALVRAAAETCKDLVVSRWASDPVVERSLGFDYGCTTDGPRRTREHLEILTIDRDHVEECDVVVVGSGAGGAVAARELAEVGLSVVVVEEGPPRGDAGSAGAPALRRDMLYRANGLARAAGTPGSRLLLGLGVGGTTTVSYGTAMRAPDPVLDGWAAAGIDGLDAASMRPYYERVERTLRVQPMQEDLAGPAARVLAAGIRERGVSAVLPRRAVDGCRGCGVCDAGCPTDAILSTAETYLPRAQRAGATIIADARVTGIVVEEGRARAIVARTATGATLTVRAKVVILAAGAVHTPSILADSALGDLAGKLGTNLSVQPWTLVVGRFPDDMHAWRGVQQSLVVTEWLESHGLLLHAYALGPSQAGHIPGAGRVFSERLEDLARMAAVQVSVADAGSGRVVRGRGGRPRVEYDLSTVDARRLIRGVEHAADLLFAAGARSVLTGVHGAEEISSATAVADAEDAAAQRRGVRITASAPSGTAMMGADPTASVCDEVGAVRGVEGLFVADASILPSNTGVQPMTTIMAMATRTVDHLVRQSARYF